MRCAARFVVGLLFVLILAPSEPPTSTMQSGPSDGFVVEDVEGAAPYDCDGWWKDMWDWIDSQLRLAKPDPSRWRSGPSDRARHG